MRKIQSFDPSATASGTIDPQIANPCGVLYLFNDSQVSLTLTFADGATAQIPPWFFRPFRIVEPGIVQWQQDFTLTSSSPPVSKIYGEAYERTEAELLTFYEGPLPRQQNIGNTVQTSMSSTDVVNEGNPAGTNVVRAKQSGSSGNNLEALNDGTFLLAQWVSAVYTELLRMTPGASPLLKLGKGLTVQGTNSAGVLANIFGIDGSNNTYVQNHSGDKTRIYDKDGNVLLECDGANNSLKVETITTNINGTTAGSAQLYQPFTSTNFKVLLLIFNGYRNASVTEQTIALPVAFSTRCIFVSGNGKQTTPYSGGSPLVSKVNKNSAGVATPSNTIDANYNGEIIQGFDALGLGINQASAASAIYVFVGI